MPTYEYECTRCGLVIEEFKPMSAPRRQRCTKCRGKVERLVSGGTGVLFKGSGFYVNDSRAKTERAGDESAPAKDGGPQDSQPKASRNDINKATKDKS